jgi:hypothetical protein
MNQSKTSNECCPQFDPKPWDNATFEWKDKRFIKDQVFCLFYMPLNFGSVMQRLTAQAEKANAALSQGPWLSDHTSPFNMDLYLAVEREVPGASNVAWNGQYFSRVYEGDFKNTRRWCEDFKAFVKAKGLAVGKWFMWYTTCPRCAAKFGKNYVVILGKAGA